MTQAQTNSTEQGGIFNMLRNRWETKVVAPAVIVLGAVGLASCAGQGEGNPNTSNPSLTMEETLPPETVAPSPEVSERYEGSDFELSEPLPEELKYLQALSPEEFAKADKYDQMRWATWALQYKPGFVQYFGSVSGLASDESYSLSPDSDLSTMLKDAQASERIAANFGSGQPETPDDNGNLDSELAEKVIIAISSSSNVTKADNFIKNLEDYRDGKAVNVVSLARDRAFDMVSDSRNSQNLVTESTKVYAPDGKGNVIELPGFTFSYTDNDGNEHRGSIAVAPVIDFRGNETFISIYD